MDDDADRRPAPRVLRGTFYAGPRWNRPDLTTRHATFIHQNNVYAIRLVLACR